MMIILSYIIIIAYKGVSLQEWALYYFETTGTPAGDYVLWLVTVRSVLFFRDGEQIGFYRNAIDQSHVNDSASEEVNQQRPFYIHFLNYLGFFF